MTFTAATPYRTIGDTTLAAYEAEFRRMGSPMLRDVSAIYAAALPHSALFLAMAWHEQRYATTSKSIRPDQHNPVGLRPWDGDPAGMPPGATGRITVSNGGQYLVFDSFANCVREWKRRLFDDPAYKGGVYVRTTTLQQMLDTYAPPGDVHEVTEIDNADSGYGADVLALLNRLEAAGLLPANVEASPMADKPYILLVAGHRSFGDGGNPVERALTDDLAAAYLSVFRSAGYTADWFQAIDGDDDPTMTRGGLDGVALGCARVLAARRESLSIILDLHFNGSRSPVHVIPPHNRRNDGRGALTTAYVQGRVADDVMANNPLDVSMASAIARQIVADVPGMTLLGGMIPGVMPESSSGVGLDGYRLAMMAATAPSRLRAVRLTIEHGGTNDASRPDFFARCAQAALRAVNATLAARNAGGDGTGGGSPDPVPEEPEEEQPTVPALVSFLFGSVDGYQFDANGPVSKLWLEAGKQNDRYPRLTDVLVDGTLKHFIFGDGSVIVADGTKPVYWLEDVAA